MRKILSIIAISFMFVTFGFAQTTIFEDDFEAFTSGDYVTSGGNFETWSGTTGEADDALVLDDFNHTVSGANSLKVELGQDIIYSFADRTSGNYQVKFWYYIATGDGGYFNIQHVFGNNWAMSVTMSNGGSGELTYDRDPNQQTVAFTFPHDVWFEIVMDIDIDNDNIDLTINDIAVNSWVFSMSESAGGALNVLDCVNFYGAANAAPYYVDDFEFIELAAGVEKPEVDLSATDFSLSNNSNATLTISNSGGEVLEYEALVNYPAPNSKNYNNSIYSNNTNTISKVVNLTPSTKKLDKPVKVLFDTKDFNLTQLTSDIAGSLGWGGTSNVDAEVAALFKYDNNVQSVTNLNNYIGMEISQVIIMANDVPAAGSTELRIYNGRDGIENGPNSAPVTTETFTVSTAGEQVVVPVTEPVYIGGKDLFVAWTFTQLPGEHCVSMDAGPPSEGANWTKNGVAWGPLTEASFGNFGIVAVLTGTEAHQWLTLSSTQGTVAIDESADIDLQLDFTGMVAGDYTCDLILKTTDNDDDESYIEIPVSLTAGINDSKTSVVTYPNPISDFYNVIANETINNIKVLDISGKLVKNISLNSNSHKINTSDLQSGVYFIIINTINQTVTKKVTIK